MNYQALAQRTCPENYHVGLVPPGLLMGLMMDAANVARALDTLKKAYAYGKPLPDALKPMADSSADVKFSGDLDGHVLHAILGTFTEAGELVEAAMKTLFNGETFDVVNFQEEMGDVAWYRAIGLAAVGQTIEDNDTQNIDKLVKRFPEKFDEGQALNRDLVAERVTLQGYNAELRDAQWFGDHIYGKMFGDAAGRFPDGTDVHTTDVVSHDGYLFTTKSGSVYKVTFLKDDDHAQDIHDAVIFSYGPDHDRIRHRDGSTGRIVKQPFIAGDEYGGKYLGQHLVTDETSLYRIHGTLTDERPAATPPKDEGNGISRVEP